MTSRLRTMTGATVLLVALAGTTAWGDYRDAYLRGYQAVERRQWQEAERWLRDALAEQPREGERIRISGNFVRDYLPHYYLGVALFNQGRLAEARLAWEESSRQGVITSRREGRQLTEYLSRPEVIAAQADAGTTSPAPTSAAGGVRVGPTGIGGGAEARGPELPAAAPGESTPLQAPAPGVSVPLTVPTELRAAARAHFSARYPDAVALLSTVSYPDAGLQVHAHVIRAAARYAMYALDGERDSSLRQLAIDDVLACRNLASDFRPDRDAFSPRFIRFFEMADAGTR